MYLTTLACLVTTFTMAASCCDYYDLNTNTYSSEDDSSVAMGAEKPVYITQMRTLLNTELQQMIWLT